MKRKLNIYEEITAIQEAGKQGALVTVVEANGSTPREAGAKMIVLSTGEIIDTIGGGVVEKYVINEALKVIKNNSPVLLHYSLDAEKEGIETGMICGGDMTVFIEPIINTPSLYIFGAGHIGKALYKIALLTNFNTHIYDTNKESIDFEYYSDAAEIKFGPYNEIIKDIIFKKPSFIVIATKSHYTDEIVLREILKQNIKFSYIGMVASKKKSSTIKEHLLKEGISEDKLNSVKSPVGLPINSETPSEIAVSIFAEIISVKNSGKEVNRDGA